MRIHCWGARGSIPVSGKQFAKYGGDTACLEIRNNSGEVVVVDTGSGARALGNKLLQEKDTRINILYTHAHWDHILGFPFFKPIYIKGKDIDVFGARHAQASIRDVIATIMKPPYFPVKYGDMNCEIHYHDPQEHGFAIGSLTIVPIALSHPNEGFGYKFTENGKTLVYLTDNELIYKHPGGLDYSDYLAFSKNADLLIHDAEYTQEEYDTRTKTWGHSVYTDALKLAMEADVKKLGLFHHNQDRGDEGIDGIVDDCKQRVAKENVSIEVFGVQQGCEIDL